MFRGIASWGSSLETCRKGPGSRAFVGFFAPITVHLRLARRILLMSRGFAGLPAIVSASPSTSPDTGSFLLTRGFGDETSKRRVGGARIDGVRVGGLCSKGGCYRGCECRWLFRLEWDDRRSTRSIGQGLDAGRNPGRVSLRLRCSVGHAAGRCAGSGRKQPASGHCTHARSNHRSGDASACRGGWLDGRGDLRGAPSRSRIAGR
jgi:hypothetical protein